MIMNGKPICFPALYMVTNGKEFDFLLSYLCTTFVVLMERQVLPIDKHGKARKNVSLKTRKHGKLTCCGLVKNGKVYDYEQNTITFFIVIPLSYLCKVELNSNKHE
jgi:hypothetical protein